VPLLLGRHAALESKRKHMNEHGKLRHPREFVLKSPSQSLETPPSLSTAIRSPIPPAIGSAGLP
jgi:hypothetical protein